MEMIRITIPAVIESGQSLSAAIDLFAQGGVNAKLAITPNLMNATAVVGIVMPAEWTAANLTLQGSSDGLTFNDVYDETGGELVIEAAAAPEKVEFRYGLE